MPVLTVKQSITPQGRVQVEVANTSGMDAEQQPCSVVFSLRSSHPHFFYHRGVPSEDSNPSSGLAATGVNVGAGGGPAPGGPAAIFAASNPTDVFTQHAAESGTALLRLSDAVWREHGVSALRPGDSVRLPGNEGLGQGTGHVRSASSSAGGGPLTPGDRRSSTRSFKFRSTSLSERPLLIQEELPDGVLLPGEARLFLLDLDDPEYISEILAREEEQQEASRRRRREMMLADSNHGPGCLVRGGRGSDASGGGGAAGRVVYFAPDVKVPNSPGVASDVSNDTSFTAPGASPNNNNNRSSSQNSRGHTGNFLHSVPETSSGEDEEEEDSSYRATPPLSIVRDSAGRTSPAPAGLRSDHHRGNNSHHPQSTHSDGRLSFSITTSSQRSGSAGSQNTLGGGHHQVYEVHGRHGTNDSYARSLPSPGGSRRRSSGGGGGYSSSEYHMSGSTQRSSHTAARGAAEWGGRRLPRPIFYVLYERLGDEDKCVENARAWLKKENKKYHAWQSKYIDFVARLEQRRRRACGLSMDADSETASMKGRDGLNQSTRSDYREGGGEAASDLLPLRGLRIIPPALGEGVRWRRDDGYTHNKSTDAHDNLSMQAAYCSSAFYYYYGFLFDQDSSDSERETAGGPLSASSAPGNGKRTLSKLRQLSATATRSASTGAQEIHRAAMPQPPLFAAAHKNQGASKAAQKMFKRTRVGGGTVVLFLKAGKQRRLRSALKVGWVDKGPLGPMPESRHLPNTHNAAASEHLHLHPQPHHRPQSPPFPGQFALPATDTHGSAPPSYPPSYPASRQASGHAPRATGDSVQDPHGPSTITDFRSSSSDEDDDDDDDEDHSVPLLPRQTTAAPTTGLDAGAPRRNPPSESPRQPPCRNNSGCSNPAHDRVRSGRGLALLDDTSSIASAGSPRAPFAATARDEDTCLHSRASSGPPPDFAATRVFGPQRTNTLDPSTVAAMAAQLPPPPPPLPDNMPTPPHPLSDVRRASNTATTANSSSRLSYEDAYEPIQLQNSLPSFASASPRSQASAPPPPQYDPAARGAGVGLFSPDGEDAEHSGGHVTSVPSMRRASGHSSSPSPTNSYGESFMDVSFAKMNDVLNYWFPRGPSASSGEHEGGEDRSGETDPLGSYAHLETPEEGDDESTVASSLTCGGGRVLTDAPPCSIRSVFTRSNGAANTPSTTSPRPTAPGQHGAGAAWHHRGRMSPSQVSRKLVEVTTRAGNGAAVRAVEGVKLAMPVLSQGIDFLVNTVVSSALPQAATTAYEFTTETVLTPENVSLLTYMVLPMMAVVSMVVVVWAMLFSGGAALEGGLMYDANNMLL